MYQIASSLSALYMKICLFGGSFDPVHTGHLAIAKRAVQSCGLDKVLFLPCSLSPLKTGQPTALGTDRLAMLQLAVADLPWAEVNDRDLRFPPPSWSWRLVKHFAALYPHDQLYWLMGTDQWDQLEHWRNWQEFTAHVTLIVHTRGLPPLPKPGINALFISGTHPASSTRIRQCIAHGSPIPEGWLLPSVTHYIDTHRLYR